MILIDSNIPMYLVGAPHRHKSDARHLLERSILNRYVAIDRREAIQPAFDAILGVVDAIYPVEIEDVERAKEILQGNPRLSPRDAVHAAIMRRHEIAEIMSFDTGFDDLPGITRLRV